ncbi:unnamed protein product [Linum trigynum]|uniref:Uncharacterized protein n=1 Tax=Linum trigynum TaxID=586398 RepID=A0AAV2E1F8_9ROSI
MKAVAGASGVNGDEGRSKSAWVLASDSSKSARLDRKSDDPEGIRNGVCQWHQKLKAVNEARRISNLLQPR